MNRLSFQLWYAAITTLLGVVLLFCSFYAPPEGEISPTVMVAFGEIRETKAPFYTRDDPSMPSI